MNERFALPLISILIIVGLIVGFIFVAKEFMKPTFNEKDYSVKVITVKEGDTLSTYYRRYAKEGTNYNEYLSAIKSLNKMRTSTIYAGDLIEVYVAK